MVTFKISRHLPIVMYVVSRTEFEQRHVHFTKLMKSGLPFIYPTDTIYGLGCNALIDKAVERLRSIKPRYQRPFSIIAPSKEWIYDYCHVDSQIDEWIAKLPGPYTLLLRLKDKSIISPLVNNGLDTIGVRIPEHWFCKVLQDIGYPFITTSANRVGEMQMTSIENLAPEIEQMVEFIIYEGEKEGNPSTIIDLTTAQARVARP